MRPASLDNYFRYPVTFIVPVGVVASLAAIWLWNRQPAAEGLPRLMPLSVLHAGRRLLGRLSRLLPATTGPANDITLSRAISGPHTLAVGLAWWLFGMALAVGYFVFVYSRFKGKADAHAGGH